MADVKPFEKTTAMNAALKQVAARNRMTLTLSAEGMERALRAVPGVTEAALNHATERADVTGVRRYGSLEHVRSGQCVGSAAFSSHASVRRHS